MLRTAILEGFHRKPGCTSAFRVLASSKERDQSFPKDIPKIPALECRDGAQTEQCQGRSGVAEV